LELWKKFIEYDKSMYNMASALTSIFEARYHDRIKITTQYVLQLYY
jgi:hypothetical protein